MKIKDFVYGQEEIREGVLVDLINSGAIQRLKRISQFGLPDEYYHKKGFSRYYHSLGVLILLKRLDAGLEEQVAGLLHDVSHLAFSHVVDWVLGDPTKEDYQDRVHVEFFENSNLPGILEKYGFDSMRISDLENFSLLDRPAPSLCIDRFDYAIREIKDFETHETLDSLMNSLVNYKGQVAFTSKRNAEIFAFGYVKCQNEHWAGEQARLRYYILATILKKAMEQKIISIDDLKKRDDDSILNLLRKSQDREILDKLDLLRNGFKIQETDANEGIILEKKFRYIDPEVLVNGRIKRLSEISCDYHTLLEKEKQNSNSFKKILILGT